MITLAHGDDLEKLEDSIVATVSTLKSERIDGSKIKVRELEEKLLGESLFGDEILFIIENIYKNKAKKEIFNFLKSNSKSFSAVFVERSKLNKRDLGALEFEKIEEYVLPQYYFKFLDDFYPHNAKSLSTLYNQLLKNMTSEQIYYSLIKRMRGLMAVKYGLFSHSEIARFAPWQLGKIRSQARMWDEKSLSEFYKKLYEVEVKMKSSALPLSLEKYLDILIRTELN